MSALIPAALAASLLWPWPFGGDDAPRREDTIESLEDREAQIPEGDPIVDAEARARENYARYLELIEGNPDREAEALRRLADLELEAGEAAALDSGVDALRPEDYAEAVALYQRMLDEHPEFERNDLVYYQLARAQESGGNPAAALDTLDQLVAEYPDSPLIDEVQFRRGELLFSDRQWRPAELAYAAVLALPEDSDFREPARYKHGWTLFKQGDYDRALESFLALLDQRLGDLPAGEVEAAIEDAPRAQRELLDDTLRVASLSFSYLDGQQTIQRKLDVMGRPGYGHVLYIALADLYLEQERYTDAADVLGGFVDANPLHPRAPYMQIAATEALMSGGFPGEALAQREAFVEEFGLDQPFWETHATDAHPEAVAYLRESVWMLAQQAHAAVQDLAEVPPEDADAAPADAATRAAQRDAQSTEAAAWYRRYLDYFPSDERAPEANFLLAELLFDSGRYVDAVAEYEATAYDYPEHERSAEAGYASLIAYQRQLDALQDPEARARWRRDGLDARLRFADRFPQHENAVLARLDAAEGLYQIGEPDAAVAAAQGVIDAEAASAEQRRVAWQVVGHARFDAKQWAEAEAAYLQMREIDAQDGRVDPALYDRLAASVYRQGEAARAAGDAVAAAGHFQRVATVAPNSEIRVTADYDAAMTLMEAGETTAAIPLMQSFRDQHGDSELSDDVTASLAVAYVETGDRQAAAREFERIAQSPGSAPAEQQEALLRAAELHQERGDTVAEARALEQFVTRFPGEFNDALEAQQRLFELAGERGDGAARQRWARALVAFDASAGPARSDRSRYLAAQASMALARPTQAAFEAVQLRAPLADNLKLKRSRMETALQAYAQAAEYGVGDVLTEATYETAELYSGLADALMASERPAGLDAVALEEYEFLLEEQAFPFEEKAIEIHEANVRRAASGQYDPWVRRSYAALAELLPARWGKSEIGTEYVDEIR